MKISVITINRNNRDGLAKTIKSIVGQSFRDFEFIIIDGQSSDGSKELIESYSEFIAYWQSEKDSGVYNAMNQGIRRACGDYVIFLNSGDCFIDNSVLSDMEQELRAEYDIVYGNNIDKFSDGNKDKLITYPAKLNFSYFYYNSLNHQATFIKRKLFEDHFYYSEEFKIVSDWEFFIYTICCKNATYKYVNRVISIYDVSGISSNPLNMPLMFSERDVVYKKYFAAFLDDYKYYDQFNSKYFQKMLFIKKGYFRWKILKFTVKILILFTRKFKYRGTNEIDKILKAYN